jgi:hypothetical protein
VEGGCGGHPGERQTLTFCCVHCVERKLMRQSGSNKGVVCMQQHALLADRHWGLGACSSAQAFVRACRSIVLKATSWLWALLTHRTCCCLA